MVVLEDGGEEARCGSSGPAARAVSLTLAGRLDLPAAAQLQRTILKYLAEPPAIVCDLGQVEGIDSPVRRGVHFIRHPALDWPGTA